MRSLELGFVARVKVLLIVGGAAAGDGGVDKLHALSGVRRKAQFTDEEWERISVLEGAGSSTYRVAYACPGCGAMTMRDSGRGFVCTSCMRKEAACPEPGFGRVRLELEEAEATWLRRRLQEWLPYAAVGDEEWYEAAMESLTTKVAPRVEPKRSKRG